MSPDRIDDALEAIADGAPIPWEELDLAPGDVEILQAIASLAPGIDGSPTTVDHAEADEEEDETLLGSLFHDKYRIVRRIGKGGFGTVYEARDERGAGNSVALKVLHQRLSRNPAMLAAFRNEAIRVTRLSHPSVVDWKVFDETPDGRRYFVMELVRGEALSEILEREAPLDPSRTARMLLQILEALRAAHHLGKEESILHLDLKPSNVFVIPPEHGGDERVKVIDFGIGQYVGGEEEDLVWPEPGEPTPPSPQEELSVFRPTMVSFSMEVVALETPLDESDRPFKRSTACTPEYASPEHCRHVLGLPDIRPLDGRADLYSFGVMAFQMLSGRLPFERPAVRADMLRLHMEEQPLRLRHVGIKVPSKIAGFIERCLAKAPDQRFADTHEAYERFRRIVHPPVSRTVAKVVTPLVAVGLLLFGGLWSQVKAQPILVSLATAGIDLTTEPLYLGPERSSVVLELPLSVRRLDLPQGTTIGVVTASGGAPLPGFAARWDGDSIRLHEDSPPQGALSERVELVSTESDFRFRDFQLIWLGSESWRVAAIEVGGIPLEALRRAVDPTGLELVLRMVGEASEADMERVEVRTEGGGTFALRPDVDDDGSVYRTRLDRLDLTEGENKLSITACDRAGGSWSEELSINVVIAPLSIVDIRLREGSGGEAADGFPECNKIGSRYLLTPRNDPVLDLEINRRGDVDSFVHVEDVVDRVDVPFGPRKGLASYSIPFPGLQELAGGSSYAGTIRCELDESKYVLHASGEGATRTRKIEFSYVAEAAEFDLQIPWEGSRRKVEKESTHHTNQDDLELLALRRTPVPMKLAVSWGREDGAQKATVFESEGLSQLAEREVSFSLPFRDEGVYHARARAFQYDSWSKLTGDRPDVESAFTVIYDKTPPIVELGGIESGSVLRDGSERAETVEVLLKSEEPRWASPIKEAIWELTTGGRRVAEGREPFALGGDSTRTSIPVPWGCAGDGTYVLGVQAEDEAGNVGEAATAGLTLALDGPELTLRVPYSSDRWGPRDGQWLIEVHAEDLNGIKSGKAMLLEQEDASEGVSLQLGFDGERTAGAKEALLLARHSFSHDQSDRTVWIRLCVRDIHDAESTETYGPFRLSEIRPPKPSRVESVQLAGKASRMRLVPGNTGFTYFFGGRGDDLENEEFRRAGLRGFHENYLRARPRSWQIEYAQGEIHDFYLDEHEVSCGQFLAFLEAGEDSYMLPDLRPAGSGVPKLERLREIEERLRASDPDLPVSGVTWEEASAYAYWVGKRLPSWVEWEYAARGGEYYRPFPGYDQDRPVPAGRNPNVVYGGGTPQPVEGGGDLTVDTRLWNLAGNVAEWTASPVAFDGAGDVDPRREARRHFKELLDTTLVRFEAVRRVWIAGGSFASSRYDFSVADAALRDWASPSVGFRCAASLDDLRQGLLDGRFRKVEP